jgi:methionyl-tRNA formyltransferase
MSLRIVFFGTGEFAVPSFEALRASGHQVLRAVCQPDRPKGRGHQLQAPPLKLAALGAGVEVFQPEKVRDADAVARVLEGGPDLAVVVSYGQLLPEAVLKGPRLGCVNVHASLLPRWRGAAPIEWALASGDPETGVSIQRMVRQLDAGDVLAVWSRRLTAADEAPALHRELAVEGAHLLLKAVAELEAGTAQARPQDPAAVTLAPLLKKSDGVLDFSRSRAEVLRRFRAFKERPGVVAALEGGEPLRVLAVSDGGERAGVPGTLLEIGAQGFTVACADGVVHLERLRPPSGKEMGAADYARGRGLKPGGRFAAP